MKTFIAISTGITAVVSLLFLATCGSMIYSVGNAQNKMDECMEQLNQDYPLASELTKTTSCAKWLKEQL